MKKLKLIVFLTTSLTIPGCVEISYWLTGEVPGQSGGGSGGLDNQNRNINDNSTPGFAVRLTASNVTPVVGEEIILTCSVVTGPSDGVRFSYEPMSTRLNVNAQTGRATFVISEPDVGVAFMVRCFGDSSSGDSAASNVLTIIASRPPA